jgi:DNA topoisomerase-1
MILVIVESPSKCKKIEEYLGENYKVIASFGHIREIKTIKNIDIQNNFQTNYEIIEEKKQIIKNIQKQINKSVDIILATDNDNEGEAIAWHICKVFNLPIELTKRITFNEITYSAIQNSIKNPRFINMNIVFSQQTRQILDILIDDESDKIKHKGIGEGFESMLSSNLNKLRTICRNTCFNNAESTCFFDLFIQDLEICTP